jgi:CHAT domain-containing protein
MQAYVTFSPTLDVQHSRIVSRYNIFETLPLDYASYQIHTNRLEQAIETLERGRALMWSEMRGLRTSVDRIHLADSGLAEKFAAVNRDLEALTFSFSPNSNFDWQDNGIEGFDPYGHLVLRQRKLQDDREKLISQIQTLPGFDTFLKPPAFDILRSAASHGPVIIINHSRWGSNIVIITHNAPPTLVPTSDDFYSRANKLQDQFLGARMNGLESDKYEDALRSILKELYELVGQPVIKRLKELNVPEQSRVWWCPTSVFCSLPLHAMGPIPSNISSPQYFLDLYTPSYTPSLSALIESRKPGSHASGKPSILLVAHPDEKMPQALKEMRAVQAVGTRVTTLFAARATPTAVLASLRDHAFAHIVCHGILEPGKPFEASFKLHRGKRILLLDIVRSQLPNAEFAFLSACHTAELTDESIADEMLHLAAAMQFCGFRSVVGTMWAMADIDGRDLARHFYESLFSDKWQGVRYYERTAVALRDAVAKLRRKGGITLERWVNFVHYGA